MRKDQKLLNFRQEVGSTSSSRGRPARHISECFRTIAWYHFLAAGRSATDVANLTPFDGVDLVTIYRYRRGQRSPKPEFLDADDEFFAAARNVYEIGPFRVPLWDAMWGSLTPADLRMADRLMPAGDWPQSHLSEMFFDDAILARIIYFRTVATWDWKDAFTSDLKAFSTALRVFRAWNVLGQGNPLALRVLLEGVAAFPGARGILEEYGLTHPIREWIASQFDTTRTADGKPIYWAAWMVDDDEFKRHMRSAESRRLQLLHGLRSTPEGADFDQETMTDRSTDEIKH